MKRFNVLRSLVVLFVFSIMVWSLIPSAAEGAVPQLINFQGILRDGSGNPVADGNYSVVFTIYEAPSAGNVKWTETQSVSTVNGLFSVLLGSVSPVADSVFNDSSRWLGIQVGADPEMTPRQRLVSGAYSLRVAHFIPDLGTNNTFIGRYAGNLTMTGSGNTASGDSALASITTGGSNTATGAFALLKNTTGNLNTASGRDALFGNTTGVQNTANGASALGSNFTGSGNTASGAFALLNNTIGEINTASGYIALLNNSSGSFNTASGAYALYSNTTANENTASGAFALENNTTGFENTASGAFALQGNTTGNDNAASGRSALVSNTTGNENTASGFAALQLNTAGGSNTASGSFALGSNTTGSNNTAIGAGADVSAGNLTNATAVGSGAVVDASNKIRLGNAAVTVIEGQVAYTFTSDKNQKENFRPVDGAEVLKKIRGFNLTSWNYKGHDPKQFRHYGPMAQEFYAAFGNDEVGKIGTETTLNSGDVAGILMIAVQALEKRTAEVAELKARIEALEKLQAVRR